LGYQPLYNPTNNVVLNGNFDVNQAQGTYSGLTGTSATRTFDSWAVFTHGSMSVTQAQNSGAALSPLNIYNPYITNSGRITVQTAESSLASADYTIVTNNMEGYLIEPLQGRPLSLQFWVRSTNTGQFYVTLRNSNNSASYIAGYTINSANVWQQVLIQNIPAIPSGTGTWNFTNGLGLQLVWALGLGASSQTTSGNVGVWGTTTAYGTSSQVNVVGNTSNTWEVTGVQLEAGAVCTPLNYITFAEQLLRVQRYYFKTYDYATAPGAATSNGECFFYVPATSVCMGYLPFATRLRTAATVSNATIYDSVSGTINNVQEYPSTTNRAVTTIGSSGETSISNLTATSALAGAVVRFHAVVDARF
jgi:hypothetical protein